MPDFQVGDVLIKTEKGFVVKRVGERQARSPIPKGAIGVVEEGPYCSGIFDYHKEVPVQFESDLDDLPETLGVPYGLLEFAD